MRRRTGPDADRLWAELEGATEGTHGRGRDQEVISQTERSGSKAAAADRAKAAAELLQATAVLVHADPAIEVLHHITDPAEPLRMLRLRSRGAEGRTLTLEFDLRTGFVTEHRNDDPVRTIDPFDPAHPHAARDAVGESLSWLAGSTR